MTIEEFVISYLGEELEEIPVSGSVRHPMPKEFVTVELIGSETVNYITSATLSIQSWAETRVEAAELNEAVKSAMEGILSEPEISSSTVKSYNNPDLSTNKPRYKAVCELTYNL